MRTRARTGWARGRRGQTIVVAIAILFLLILVGSIFITTVVQNLRRVTAQGERNDALTLALAGLRYAGQQFAASPAGADWRPTPTEALWRTPVPPATIFRDQLPPNTPGDLNGDQVLDANEIRLLDPDYKWLSDDGTYRRPFVRVPTGRGRFLVRVTYIPRYEASGPNAVEFAQNSGLIHVEAVGRPGELDPNDPTFYTSDPTGNTQGGEVVGPYRKVDAYVPMGLVDQLWWVTNRTRERGPATLGVPGFRDGLARGVEFPAVWEGGIRSDTDLQLQGQNNVRLYPSRGEGVFVKGELRLSPRGNTAQPRPQLELQVLEDSGETAGTAPDGNPIIPSENFDDNPGNDSLIIRVDADPLIANNGLASVLLYTPGGSQRRVLLDERHLRSDPELAARSTRMQPPPDLTAGDPTTGMNRWLLLTRETGGMLSIPQQGEATRLVRAGWYGLVDQNLSPTIRAQGLYLDNHGDIQYPGDRSAVKDEWLRRGNSDTRNRGWLGDYYVPSVEEGGTLHPIAEVALVDVHSNPNDPSSPRVPKIRITRYDLDQRHMNLQGAVGRQRLFYRHDGTQLVPVGYTREFDYPSNGVFFAEGSIRLRGRVGTETDPRQLTIVSGGTIYVEGNIVKPHRASFVGLLARDYVTLNPTAFTRVQPGSDILVEADTFDTDGRPVGYHFTVQQGSDLDFSFQSAEPLGSGMIHVKHSAAYEADGSQTAVTLNLPRLAPNADQNGWPAWNTDRYDFGANRPPGDPPAGLTPYTGVSQLFYLFRKFSPGEFRDQSAEDPQSYAESNFQTPLGTQTPRFERKTFFLPQLGSGGAVRPGMDATYRLVVGSQDDGSGNPVTQPNGQPYWLSRIAVLPQDRPLPIKIEAVMYAQNGSWFVIPPPYFNDNPTDTRAEFASTGRRPIGTFPRNTDHYPFYNEPLNIEVQINGSMTENMPAAPSEQAAWVNRTWIHDPGYDPGVFPLQGRPPFSPRLRYRYDSDLKRMVRARIPRLGQEFIVWTAPTAPPVNGMMTVDQVIAFARGNDPNTNQPINSYVEFLPVLPRMPAGTLVYEGNPQQ
ncbi:MAG: hypothetical protein ACK47B_00790 [Armatimonadota bacterium]